MSEVVARRLVDHLESAGFILMCTRRSSGLLLTRGQEADAPTLGIDHSPLSVGPLVGPAIATVRKTLTSLKMQQVIGAQESSGTPND